jgi:hypothetical protein
MKFPQALLFCVVLSVFVTPSFGFAAPARSVTITFDRGGLIADYRDKYHGYERKGVSVRIDGPCLSACALVTVYLSRDHICITPKAVLGFHMVREKHGARNLNTDLDSFNIMYSYPQDITNWIQRHGGYLSDTPVYMYYADLRGIYDDCPN